MPSSVVHTSYLKTAAMQQINLKDYPARFARRGLPIVKVGINFDAERHTISDWKIEGFSLESA